MVIVTLLAGLLLGFLLALALANRREIIARYAEAFRARYGPDPDPEPTRNLFEDAETAEVVIDLDTQVLAQVAYQAWKRLEADAVEWDLLTWRQRRQWCEAARALQLEIVSEDVPF